MPLNAKLVVVGGELKTGEFALRLPATIGRGKGIAIVLAHPLVSRKHCELFESGGQLMVRDLGSLNGTFVNNQRVSESPLKPGELLTVGTVTFRAVYESQSDLQPPNVSGPYPKVGNFAEAAARRSSPGAKTIVETGAQTVDDVRETEFNFDKPLFTPEEKPAPAASGKAATRRVETTLAEEKAAKAAAKKPPAKPAPAAGGDAPTLDFKPRADEEEDDNVASTGDDDLDDFLKSLEN